MSRTIKEQLERGREYLALLREEHEADMAQARRNQMSTRKTPYGDRVPRAHDLTPVADALDELYSSAADALSEINDAAKREAQIDRARSERAAARFPNIGGAR